jgi:hypothetical protein
MRRVSSEPGEYLNAQMELDFVYAPRTIARLAKVYGLDQARLAKVLQEVVYEFDDNANYSYRMKIWDDAADKARSVLPHLEEAWRIWSRSPDRIRAVVEELTAYSTEEFEAYLGTAITVLREIGKEPSRGRGNNGASTSKTKVDPIPDLRVLHATAKLLYEFWYAEKGECMGHQTKGPIYYYEDGSEDARAITLPVSAGLRFMHRCLKYLDDRVTVENCVTRIRALKKGDPRARATNKSGSALTRHKRLLPAPSRH